MGAATFGFASTVRHDLSPGPVDGNGEDVEPFFGPHQGGIATPPQSHTVLAAFDVTSQSRRELADLLRQWTAVAAELAAGRAPVADDVAEHSRFVDSGEAVGLGPSRLTVNFGLGASLFSSGGVDRFGLATRQPWQLIDLPAFPGDALIESKSGGDLTVHACADDPQVAFHAVRRLARSAVGVATMRWCQPGYNEQSATGGTPRNLLGFKDGTVNPSTAGQLDTFVWVGEEGPPWMVGGTFLVARRIRIDLEQWDDAPVGAQQRIIGRQKVSGAPLGRAGEFDPLDLDARDASGDHVIPDDAHVRLASPNDNWGTMMLRRSYTYNDGIVETGPGAGAVDAGLLFLSYQRNARLTFIPIYRTLARRDALRRFTLHTGSILVALPPGPSEPGRWVGQQLLDE